MAPKLGSIPCNKGKKMSDTFKQKVSDAMKGKSPSQETKRKLSESAKASPALANHIADLAELHRGKKRSPEVGYKISQSKLGQPRSEDTKQKLSVAIAKAVAEGRCGHDKFFKHPRYLSTSGQLFRCRSSWEALAAGWMDSQGWNYVYEQAPIALNRESYLPDFFVYDVAGDLIKIIDVKGRYRKGIREKLERFKIYLQSCDVSFEIWEYGELKELGFTDKALNYFGKIIDDLGDIVWDCNKFKELGIIK